MFLTPAPGSWSLLGLSDRLLNEWVIGPMNETDRNDASCPALPQVPPNRGWCQTSPRFQNPVTSEPTECCNSWRHPGPERCRGRCSITQQAALPPAVCFFLFDPVLLLAGHRGWGWAAGCLGHPGGKRPAVLGKAVEVHLVTRAAGASPGLRWGLVDSEVCACVGVRTPGRGQDPPFLPRAQIASQADGGLSGRR